MSFLQRCRPILDGYCILVGEVMSILALMKGYHGFVGEGSVVNLMGGYYSFVG